MQTDQLVLGIDGGGTKTVAWLATRSPPGEASVVGRGIAGPSNPQAVGFQEAIRNLNRAIAAAFSDAQIASGTVAAAVLALAGSDREENRQTLTRWANDGRLAHSFRIVHDTLPVLVAGTAEDWGIALVSGTGSLAFGRNRHGESARAGGWGFLFGDEGSGYAIALAGLRAAAQSADGRGPETKLLPALLRRLKLHEPSELIPAVYRTASDRAAIAALAEVVIKAAAENDAMARRIVEEAAGELAAMVASVAKRLFEAGDRFPLVLSGGMLLRSPNLRSRLQDHLTSLGIRLESTTCVLHPVAGAVRLAQSEAETTRDHRQ